MCEVRLTKSQYYKIFDKIQQEHPEEYIQLFKTTRKRLFQLEYPNLKYNESEDAGTYWGVVQGDEKSINWFILNL